MSGIQQLLLGGPFGAGAQGDPNWQNVTLLSGTTNTNAGQNNTFLDSSTNNFTVTRNGNTTQGTFSPFSQAAGYWGVYFDGDADVVKLPSESAFGLGTGNFTIELWVNFSDYYASQCRIAGQYSNGTTNGWQIYKDPNSYVIRFNTNVGDHVTYTWYPSIGQWNHFAIVRSGTGAGQTKMYINGQEVASGTMSYSIVANQLIVGGLDWAANYSVNGYVSNFRYSNIARTITVPTTPYSSDANTLAILCQSNRFIETSANKTVTVVGTPFISPLQPFGAPIVPYSASTIGGSGYFDGTGDYLSVADAAALDLGTGDFTIEGWVYMDSGIADNAGIVAKRPESTFNTGDWRISYRTATKKISFASDTTNQRSTPEVNVNGWVHFAFVRSGTTISCYANGARGDSVTDAVNLDNGNPVEIGRNSPSVSYTGYISGIRITKGGALYSGTTYTVPTAPFTTTVSSGSVSLLTNFTNAGIYDQAAKNDMETVGNAQVSTSVKKYGDGSIAFDGTGDYVSMPDSPLFDFGTEQFTIEFWLYANSLSNSPAVVAKNAAQGSAVGWFVEVGSNTVYFGYGTNSGQFATFTAPLATGAWYHIACTRIGGTYNCFVNGNSAGPQSGFSASAFDNTNPLLIGRGFGSSSFDLNGYVSDLRITKGLARYPYNFTPPTTSLPNFYQAQTLTADPYFDYTTLLLPGSGTNGAQNNTFLDSSTNAFSITRNGNTTQGTFSPFSQTGWSNFFDGSGDWLTCVDNAAFELGNSDFTAECWVFPTGTAGSYYVAMAKGGGGTSTDYSWQLGIDDSGKPYGVMWANGDGSGNFGSCTGSTSILTSQWYHLAYTRSGSSFALFVNGSRVATATSSSSAANTSANFAIGASRGTSNANEFKGYISNARLVKGSAVYDPTQTSITVPTAPLTAITNTSFLGCQSNRFVDNSSNAFAITVSGTPSVQAFSPFAPTDAYSAATNGGSGYFDGTGDYLSVAGATALNYGSGDFTIECWYYPTSSSSGNISTQGDGNLPGSTYEIKFGSSGLLTINFYSTSGAIPVTFDTTKSWVLNAWNHVAVVRNGNTITCYMDGVSAGSGTATGYSFGTTDTVYIGTGLAGSGVFKGGYISNFRIVKGTAVYTAAFTPPTSPLTAISGTSLLCNFTNAGITDATAKNDLETVGNAQISNAQAKFGSTSISLSASGNTLKTPLNQDLNVGSGDFTIEGWVYFTTVTGVGNANGIFQMSNTAGGFAPNQTNNLALGTSDGNKWQIYAKNTFTLSSTTTISSGTWYHFALCRYGSTTVLYINGIATITLTSDTATYNTPYLGLGSIYDSTSYPTLGYIQDFRVTKGIARYTQNFTPPTAAFQLL